MAALPPAPVVHQTITGDHNIVTGTGDVRIVYQLPPAEAEERRALLVVLERVKQFWITGVLEGSLQGAAALELGTAPQHDAVAHPWAHVVELPAPGRPATGTTTLPIEALFDQASRALLILGAEGSGKTTALLQLARALVVRAERDPTQPIPVVLNLASWTAASGGLLPWMLGELQSKYYVPRETARAWVTRQRLALLLDGLDEVEAAQRPACGRALNHFLREFGSAGLAVCSRLDEYQAQPERLALGGAVRIEPLSADQVASYLAAGGTHLDGLRAALGEDGVLRDLATSPLLLSVMTLAYRDDAASSLPPADASAEVRRARLFDTYVQRMFARRAGAAARYAPAATLRWLATLARQMLREGQRVLLVEGLQPSWLATGAQRAAYVLLSRALAGLVLGAMEGVYLAALKQTLPDPALAALGFGTVMRAAVTLGVLFGLIVGVVDWARFALVRDERREPHERWWITAAVVALYWATFIVLLALIGIGTWRSPFGLIWALLFALRGRAQSLRTDVQPVLGLGWSRRLALRGGGWGLLAGVAVGAVAVAITSERTILYFLLYAVLGAAFGGVTRTVGASPVPGRGIALTMRAALRGGLLTGSVSGGLIALMVIGAVLLAWTTTGAHPLAPLLAPAGQPAAPAALVAITLFAGLLVGGLIGLYFGVLGALWYGGADALQHVVLRVLLCRAGVPWRLARFLDHCARLIFLQRVGGGYRFVHGALMDHFAASASAAGERA